MKMRATVTLFLILNHSVLLGQNVILETFNTVMPASWTIVDGGGSTDTWFRTTNGYNGNTLNGSQFAFVNSDAAGNAPHPLLSEQLITPTINGTLYTQLFLEFDHYYRVYSTDRGYVEVFNGSSWVILATYSTNVGAWNAPVRQTYNLTPHLNANLRVRFRYEDNNVWAWWWAVDNVRIWSPPSLDARLSSLTLPSGQCGYTANEQISVQVVNEGTSAITSLPVSYRVNGGSVVTETITATIAPSATYSYIFLTGANLSAAGVYVIDAWTGLPGDQVSSNDSILGQNTKNHIRVSTFPHYQDFEAGQSGWFVTGTSPTWAWGTPAKTTIQGASSGTRAWVTGGLGTTFHLNNEQNQVEGPCFDLSSVPGPWVGMNIWWNCEFSWDGAAVQASSNGGQTWVTIGAFADPYNWYNDYSINGLPGGSLEGWSGRASTGNGSGGYERAVHSMASMAGQPSVIVRVAFGSDGSVVDDGFAFDNFTIGNQPVLYLGADTTVCDSLVLDAGPASSYIWSSWQTTRTITVRNSGSYSVTVQDQYGFPTADQIQVTIEGPRSWDLGNDTLVCNTNPITLGSGITAQSYLWSTGDTTPTISTNTNGQVWLAATSAIGCIRSDTINLSFSPLQAGISLPSDTLCRSMPVMFFDGSTAATSWLWNFGNGNLSTNANPTTVFPSGGTFLVSLRVMDGYCADSTSRVVYVQICTGLEAAAFEDARAFPVPASGRLWIEGFGSAANDLEVSLINMLGQTVRSLLISQDRLSDKLEVDLEGLPSATYLIMVRSAEQVWSQKIIVRK